MSVERVIHIVDADAIAAEYGASILRASGYEVQIHASGREFLASGPDQRPGCVLLDIHVPEPDGLDVQEKLLSGGLSMPVIVFTGEGALDIAVRAMRAGALHYLEKPYLHGDLLVIVEEALERLDQREDQTERVSRAVAKIALLSPREVQVLQGMMEGAPNKVIAHNLELSIRTVEMHRTNLMEKMKARSLSAAFRIWFDAGR